MRNWCGWAGAQVAAAFIYFFGVTAYLCAALGALLAYGLMRSCSWVNDSERRGAALVGIVVIASMAHLYGVGALQGAVPGGLVGALLSRWFVQLFSVTGAALVLGTIGAVC